MLFPASLWSQTSLPVICSHPNGLIQMETGSVCKTLTALGLSPLVANSSPGPKGFRGKANKGTVSWIAAVLCGVGSVVLFIFTVNSWAHDSLHLLLLKNSTFGAGVQLCAKDVWCCLTLMQTRDRGCPRTGTSCFLLVWTRWTQKSDFIGASTLSNHCGGMATLCSPTFMVYLHDDMLLPCLFSLFSFHFCVRR